MYITYDATQHKSYKNTGPNDRIVHAREICQTKPCFQGVYTIHLIPREPKLQRLGLLARVRPSELQ